MLRMVFCYFLDGLFYDQIPEITMSPSRGQGGVSKDQQAPNLMLISILFRRHTSSSLSQDEHAPSLPALRQADRPASPSAIRLFPLKGDTSCCAWSFDGT